MANKEINQAYGEIRKQPAVETWGCRQGVITRNVHFPTNSCWWASPKVNISAHGYYMMWNEVPCKTVALWGKPILVANDARAILDPGPPNKHFPSSPLPFELGVGSPPKQVVGSVRTWGWVILCVFVFVPKLSKGKQQLIFSVICKYPRISKPSG